jgi:predicted nucleic acid-binding protein
VANLHREGGSPATLTSFTCSRTGTTQGQRWELPNNLTAYDAVYVALAEALEASLLTRDRHLAAAAGHRAKIELA